MVNDRDKLLRPSPHPWFHNRVAVLATMHRKEQVIAPILASALGIEIVVPEHLDTDVFGTFTRDRARTGNQREAARLKAETAMKLTGATLAIASEGTFTPHPSFPALPCNRELVLLLDASHELEVVGQVLSLDTNYRHQTIGSFEEALQFAATVGFPQHGLVVMTSATTQEPAEIIKGIVSQDQLAAAVSFALARSQTGTIHIETDMRALHNPTRMNVIAQATIELVQQIQRACPQCGCPGLELIEQRSGLPCGWCSLPTALIRSHLYHCQKCGLEQEVERPDGMMTADPAQCSYCNP